MPTRRRSNPSPWLAVLVSLACLAAGPTPDEPKENTRYLSPKGKDEGQGTLKQPWRDLAYAADHMKPGDVAYLRGGTYSVRSPIQIRAAGTAAASLTFTAYPGEKPLLQMESVQRGTAFDTLQIFGSYIVIDHLTVTNLNDPGQAVWISEDGHHNTISNCDLTAAHGVPLIISGNDNIILRSQMHDADFTPFSPLPFLCGVYVTGGRNIFRGNSIYNNTHLGIQLFGGAEPHVGGNVLEYNYIYHNGFKAYAKTPKQVIAGLVIAGASGKNSVIRYNKICDNAKYGIWLADGMPNVQLVGNVTCYSRLGGVYLPEPGPGTALKEHISYNDQGFAVFAQPGVSTAGNIFFSSNGTPKLKWAGKSVTLDEFRAATGDNSSRVANPKFKSVPSNAFDPKTAPAYDFATPENPRLANKASW